MARTLINRHFPNSSAITYNEFSCLGELIICNEVGYEGIYIINLDHKPIRIGAWTGDIEADLERLKREIEEELIQWAESKFVTQDEIDAVNERIDEIIISPIDEGHVREISSEEAAKIVDSATTYDTLRKIEEWILNSPSIDPQIQEDIDSLKAISADTRLSALESVSSNTRISNIESISADTRLDSLESLSAGTRLSVIEGKIDDISRSTDHFVMTMDQYNELLENGHIILDGELLTYNPNHFYCIYEDEGGDIPSGDTPTSGETVISGDTIIFNENYPYDDGSSDQSEPSLYIGIIEEGDDGVVSVDWFVGDGEDQHSEDVIVSGDTMTLDEDSAYIEPVSGETPYIEMEIVDISDDGIVSTDWEVEINDGSDSGETPSGGSNIDDIIDGETNEMDFDNVEVEPGNNEEYQPLSLPDTFTIDEGNGIIEISIDE